MAWVSEFSTVSRVLCLNSNLQITKLEHVPRTVFLNEKGIQEAIKTAGLKHGTGADVYIVLAPQPSQDPNDPLNWWGGDQIYDQT